MSVTWTTVPCGTIPTRSENLTEHLGSMQMKQPGRNIK